MQVDGTDSRRAGTSEPPGLQSAWQAAVEQAVQSVRRHLAIPALGRAITLSAAYLDSAESMTLAPRPGLRASIDATPVRWAGQVLDEAAIAAAPSLTEHELHALREQRTSPTADGRAGEGAGLLAAIAPRLGHLPPAGSAAVAAKAFRAEQITVAELGAALRATAAAQLNITPPQLEVLDGLQRGASLSAIARELQVDRAATSVRGRRLAAGLGIEGRLSDPPTRDAALRRAVDLGLLHATEPLRYAGLSLPAQAAITAPSIPPDQVQSFQDAFAPPGPARPPAPDTPLSRSLGQPQGAGWLAIAARAALENLVGTPVVERVARAVSAEVLGLDDEALGALDRIAARQPAEPAALAALARALGVPDGPGQPDRLQQAASRMALLPMAEAPPPAPADLLTDGQVALIRSHLVERSQAKDIAAATFQGQNTIYYQLSRLRETLGVTVQADWLPVLEHLHGRGALRDAEVVAALRTVARDLVPDQAAGFATALGGLVERGVLSAADAAPLAMMATAAGAGVTAREYEMAEHLAEGRSDPEIAERMALSFDQIERLRAQIAGRFGIPDRDKLRTDVLAAMLERGMLPVTDHPAVQTAQVYGRALAAGRRLTPQQAEILNALNQGQGVNAVRGTFSDRTMRHFGSTVRALLDVKEPWADGAGALAIIWQARRLQIAPVVPWPEEVANTFLQDQFGIGSVGRIVVKTLADLPGDMPGSERLQQAADAAQTSYQTAASIVIQLAHRFREAEPISATERAAQAVLAWADIRGIGPSLTPEERQQLRSTVDPPFSESQIDLILALRQAGGTAGIDLEPNALKQRLERLVGRLELLRTFEDAPAYVDTVLETARRNGLIEGLAQMHDRKA